MNSGNYALNARFVQAKEKEIKPHLMDEPKKARIGELLSALRDAFERRVEIEAKVIEAMSAVRPSQIFGLINDCAKTPDQEWGVRSHPYAFVKDQTEKLQAILALATKDSDQYLKMLSELLQKALAG